MNRYYEYRHLVEFEETDFNGLVYNINCLRWQAQCREMFLLEYAPSVLDELRGALEILTLGAECEQLEPLRAFDDLSIRMRAERHTLTQVSLAFDYVRLGYEGETLVAKGRHTAACVMNIGGTFTPVRVPEHLRIALGIFTEPDALAALSCAGTGGRA
jgi:enediyne core biosynthesis thioesterase